jgi:hypothetical protein
MLENYFPILLFILIGLLVGAVPIALGGGITRLLGHHRPKNSLPTSAGSRLSKMRA